MRNQLRKRVPEDPPYFGLVDTGPIIAELRYGDFSTGFCGENGSGLSDAIHLRPLDLESAAKMKSSMRVSGKE